MKTLFEAIKDHDESALSETLTLDKLNQKHDLSAEEIKYMVEKLQKRGGTITDLKLTQGLTPLFMAVLYDNMGVYSLLMVKGANVFVKTASGTNLLDFLKAFGYTSHSLILRDRHPALALETYDHKIPIIWQSKPTPIFPQQRPTSSPNFFEPPKNYTLLDTFISCCKTNDVDGLTRCIDAQTHKKDKKDSGLYWALSFGYAACVDKLLSKNTPIKCKHYFAAGLIPKGHKKTSKNAKDLYNKISPSPLIEPIMRCPDVIVEGNLAEIKALFESKELTQQIKAEYLYALICLRHLLCVRYVLTQGIELQERHYFAAAAKGKNIDEEIKMYNLLSFYKVEPPQFDSNLPEEVLGIHKSAPDAIFKRAYKQLALNYHPDKGIADIETIQKVNEAKEQFQTNVPKIRDDKAMITIAELFTEIENQEYDSSISKNAFPLR